MMGFHEGKSDLNERSNLLKWVSFQMRKESRDYLIRTTEQNFFVKNSTGKEKVEKRIVWIWHFRTSGETLKTQIRRKTSMQGSLEAYFSHHSNLCPCVTGKSKKILENIRTLDNVARVRDFVLKRGKLFIVVSVCCRNRQGARSNNINLINVDRTSIQTKGPKPL